MSENCDKGPLIEMLIDSDKETHRKLDKVIDVLTAVAVQGERVSALEKKSVDHESRIRKLEPLRHIYGLAKWGGGIGGSLVTAYLMYRAKWGG